MTIIVKQINCFPEQHSAGAKRRVLTWLVGGGTMNCQCVCITEAPKPSEAGAGRAEGK